MSFYTDLAATARSLLATYGQAITLKRTTGDSNDPVTGDVTAGTETEFTPNGVLKPFPDALVDGTRIQASDRELILDDTVAPEMDDEITIDGQDWTIVRIIGTKPAGTALVWRVQVRR